jgi:hypothetical protein
MPALKLIKLGMSLSCGISLSKFKATSLGPFHARAYTNIEADKLGYSLYCGISHSMLKATSHWALFSHALMPTLRLTSWAIVSTAASPSA